MTAALPADSPLMQHNFLLKRIFAGCSVNAIRVLATLDALGAYRDGARVKDKDLSDATGLHFRLIIDARHELTRVGRLPLRTNGHGTYIAITNADVDAARADVGKLHSRAGAIHDSAADLKAAIEFWDANQIPLDSAGQGQLGLILETPLSKRLEAFTR